MTKKLYEKDPYKREFQTDIKTIKNIEDSYHVVLNKTYFYPAGGGQPSDQGWIENKKVDYVYKEKGKVVHVMDEKPANKDDLSCRIDWDRRFDFMQQHTGQHLLSAVFKNQYGLNTVGFNLSEDSLRIDLDDQINQAKIKKIEVIVNNYIYKNIKVTTLYPKDEQLNKLNLRKEPSVDENIRIIKIGDIDFSPCGGTHLNSTGELGMIKIINVDNYKGGLRIDFVCGKRALKDYDYKNEIITELRNVTSVPDQEIISEVKRIKDELKTSEETITDLNKKVLNYQAEDFLQKADIIENVKVIKAIFTDIPYNDVQWLSDILTKKDNIICVFGQVEQSTARLLLSRSEDIDEIKMNEIISKPLELIEGQGGGNSRKAQGGGDRSENIDRAVESAFKVIKNKLK